MPRHTIALLAGDGIGEEIMRQAVKVLEAVARRGAVSFELVPAAFGASAWFDGGDSFPKQTRAACDCADAILKGVIGLSLEESEKIPPEQRPERAALLPLRRRYDTYANFRPVRLPPALGHFSPLKAEIIGDGVDIMIVRELVGGLYFGRKERGVNENGLRFVREQLEYDEAQIERIARAAFKSAAGRRGLLHSVHKSNVLQSSLLWCEVVDEVARDFPAVKVENMLVDAAATHLCLNPAAFDVMVMENLFGDILSDQAGGLLGSLGLMPSACMGPKKAYYEPAHGSAPDLAGRDLANPYAMIGSAAMMLEMSFGMAADARDIWRALDAVFAAGYATADLARPGMSAIGTDEFGDRVVAALEAGDDAAPG